MKKAYVCIILALFFLAFYLQDRYAISYDDDWCYAFVVKDGYTNYMSVADDGVERQPVASFADALSSQRCDYFKTNGRFVLHALVQYFCGTFSMHQYVVLNSLVFALLTLLLLWLVGWRNSIFGLLAVLSAIWVLLPHKGLVYMGNISIGVNYMWTSAATLLFIAMLEHVRQRRYGSLAMLPMCVAAAIIGSLQESFSICIGGALLLCLFFRRTMASRAVMLLAVAYILGAAFCILSPANFNRADTNEYMGFSPRLAYGLLSSPPVMLLLAAVAIGASKGCLLAMVKRHLLLFAAIMVNLLFMLLVAYNGRHQLTAVNLLSLLLLFRLLRDYRTPMERTARVAFAVLIAVAVVSWYPVLSARKAYHNAFMAVVDQAQTSADGIVSVSPFETLGHRLQCNPILECNYVMPFFLSEWDFKCRSLSVFLTNGESNSLIKETR